MYKALVRTPLQQATMLLWLAGAALLLARLAQADQTWKWSVSAALAAALLLLIGGRVRSLAVVPVAVVLGLAAILAGAFRLGVTDWNQLNAVGAAYGLLAWRISTGLFRLPGLPRLTGLLGLRGGYASPGGRALAERYLYWSSFALIVLSLGVEAASGASVAAVLAASLPVLALGLLFFALSGHRYRMALNSYLVIALAAWGILGVFAAVALPQPAALPLADPRLGLLLALSGALAVLAGHGLKTPMLRDLYGTPCRNAAATLALLAIGQVILLGVLGLQPAPGWIGIGIVALGSAVLLVEKRHLLQPAMTTVAALSAVGASIWEGLAQAQPTWTVSVSAALAAALLLLAGGRLRMLAVVPVAVVLGLGTILAGVYQLGVTGPNELNAVGVAYGLVAWRLAVGLVRLPGLFRLAGLLGLRGGYPAPGGAALVERYIYWSSFALIVLSLAIEAATSTGETAILAASLPVLALGLLFFALSGHRYRTALDSHLVIALAAWGFLGAFTWVAQPQPAVLPLVDPRLGLLLALSGALAVVAAHGLKPATLRALYATPCRNASAMLALLAIGQVVLLGVPGLQPAPGRIGVAVLALGSAVLLVEKRHLLQPAMTAIAGLSAVWAAIWAYTAVAFARPPAGLWPGGSAGDGEWLVLAAGAVVLGVGGHGLLGHPHRHRAYAVPIMAVAALAWVWSLAGALALYPTESVLLPWITLFLMAALFPLLRGVDQGPRVRGVSMAIMSSFLVAAALGPDGRGAWGAQAAFAWAFALWAAASFLLPRVNGYLRAWAVAPQSWPWLGLATLGLGLGLAYEPGVPHWGLGAMTGVYMLAMLRHSPWPGFSWLAVLALSAAAVMLSTGRHQSGLQRAELTTLGAFALENLLWANLLLGLVPAWARHGATLAARLHWNEPALRAPLLFGALAFGTFWLLGLLLWDAALILTEFGSTRERTLAVVLGALLTGTLIHGVLRWRTAVAVHLVLAAAFLTALAAWGIAQPLHLPLALVLWSAVLAAGWALCRGGVHQLTVRLGAALRRWLNILPFAGFLALVAMPEIPIGEQNLTVALLVAVVGLVGVRRQSRFWLYSAAAFAVLLLHGLWFLAVPIAEADALLPFYAAQFALVTWGLRQFGHHAHRTLGTEAIAGFDAVLMIGAAALALSEWGIHVLIVAQGLLEGAAMARLAGVAAPLILAALCVREVWRTRADRWVYGAVALAGLAAVYFRVLWVGLAPLGAWDTAAIIGSSYALFAMQRLTGSRPVLNLTMTLPMLALLTVPFQLASAHATLTLFAIGVLYLAMRHATRIGTPLYLALLALNAGIYLWVPDWASEFGLLQAYVVPATLSVLLLLHLHRHELRNNVLNGARLTSLSVLYSATTLDVFLQDELAIFVLALGLSLAGIGLGIVTRTRAFLYAGVAFLVVNVVGQLLLLYPEQRLARALLLMGLGAAITAAMIWFSLKREAIMARIRIFRADLATWD